MSNRSKSVDSLKSEVASLDFRTLVGYDGVLKKLASLYAASRLPPALLIEGRKGMAKRVFAAAVSSLPFCRYGVACGQCEPCQSIIHGFNEDILWLENDENSFKIDDMKKLQEHLSIRSSQANTFTAGSFGSNLLQGGMRIVVIVDADKLSDQAANRFLKTLEEPADQSMIIMTTSNPKSILPTILSRVVKWRVAAPDVKLTIPLLQRLLSELDYCGVDDKKIEEFLIQSGRSPGLALKKIVARDDEKDGMIETSLAKILAGGNAIDVLDIAEKLGKNSKINLSDLVEKLEMMLNCNYMKYLAASGGRAVNIRRLQQRRQILNEVRRYAVRGRIALNSQLILENLGLNPDV